MNKLYEISFLKNIPIYATFELTHRCNLNCRHCYQAKDNKKEMNTDEVKYILKTLAKNNVLELVLTGGEPLLKSDFLEICEYARDLYLSLRMFTNGTLLTEEIVIKLKDIGITSIDISLYGREKTHDYITNVKDSYKITMKALWLLKKHKIRTTIKCPLMRQNYNDYEYIIKLARELKMQVKFDVTITPKDDGSKKPLKYRMTKEQTKDVIKKLIGKVDSPNKEKEFNCSAGRNFIGIDPQGNVYPCLQLLCPLGNLLKMNFNDIWNSKAANFIRKIPPETIKDCFGCDNSVYCRRCPGLALIESGSMFGISESACRLAKIYKEICEQ